MADIAYRIGPTLLSGVAATIRTVSGVTFHLTTVNVTNTTASAATLFVSIGADAAGTRIISQRTVKSYDVYQWTGFVPVFNGEIIQAYSGTASALTITLSGVDV